MKKISSTVIAMAMGLALLVGVCGEAHAFGVKALAAKRAKTVLENRRNRQQPSTAQGVTEKTGQTAPAPARPEAAKSPSPEPPVVNQ